MSIIRLNNIIKIHNKKHTDILALNNISIKIEEGEMLAITGISGCGKTTLLNIIGCIDKNFEGDYFLESKNISKISSKESAILRNEVFGYVLQNFALIDDTTVFKNVLLPIIYSKNKNRVNEIDNILSSLNILHKRNELVINLSGGEKQRVAIARALINNPKIILADEPTSAIDTKNANEVMEIFKKINSSGKTIIIVTHDAKVLDFCSRIVKMEDGKFVV